MTKRSADMTPEELARTRAQGLARRNKDRDKANAATRKWRAANIEAARASDRKTAEKRRREKPEQMKANAAEYRARNRKRLSELQKKWVQADPERALNVVLKTMYGITLADYDAKHAAQGGLCAVCFVPGPARGKTRLCVDHCHASGKVRALLCSCCNTGLGYFKDEADRLRRAAAYVELHASPAIEQDAAE